MAVKTLGRESHMQDGQLLQICKHILHIGKASLNDITIVQQDFWKLKSIKYFLSISKCKLNLSPNVPRDACCISNHMLLFYKYFGTRLHTFTKLLAVTGHFLDGLDTLGTCRLSKSVIPHTL